MKTLLGNTRVAPPASGNRWAEQGGLYPFLSAFPGDLYARISHVSFSQRAGNHSGAFFDYTLVMGLRDNLTPSGGSTSLLFETLADQMNLTSLLDLPLLSQQRTNATCEDCQSDSGYCLGSWS